MFYEYVCDECQETRVVQATMAEGPPTGLLCSPPCEATMRRLYVGQSGPAIIQWDSATYMDRAYEGREDTGMRLSQVRAIIDAQSKEQRKGQANARDYRRSLGSRVH